MWKVLFSIICIVSHHLAIAQNVLTPSANALPQTINLRQLSKDDVAPTAAKWSTTGYTIIGVLYVAGAMATMRAHGDELDAAFKGYLANNPQSDTLDKIFNNDLLANLKIIGIKTNDFEVKFEDKEAIIDPSRANGNLVFSINKLESGFLAAADDKPYRPIVSVSFSQLDGAVERQKAKAMAVNMTLPEAEQVQYDNFDQLLADAPNAFIALQKVARAAAKQCALAIKDALIKSQKTAETNANPA